MKRIVLVCLLGLAFLAPVQSALGQPDPQDDKRFKELRKQLLDPDPRVVAEAARQLREISGLLFNTDSLLAIGLESRYPTVRAEAAQTLAALGPRAGGTVFALARAIKKEKNDGVLGWMITALGAIAPRTGSKVYTSKALPAILPFTTHKNPDIRWKAAAALGNFGEKAKVAVPALRKLLHDPTPPPLPTAFSISMVAMESLQQIGAKDKETIDALFKITESKDLKNRTLAMVMLTKLVPKHKRLLPALLEWLKNKDSIALRRSAVGCLVLLGPGAKDAVPELINALKFYDPADPEAAKALRYYALRALAAIGPAATSALPEIQRLAQSDPDRAVRREAAKILKSLEKQSK